MGFRKRVHGISHDSVAKGNVFVFCRGSPVRTESLNNVFVSVIFVRAKDDVRSANRIREFYSQNLKFNSQYRFEGKELRWEERRNDENGFIIIDQQAVAHGKTTAANDDRL